MPNYFRTIVFSLIVLTVLIHWSQPSFAAVDVESREPFVEVSATAKTDLEPDAFRLVLAFPTEAGSFLDAQAKAKAVSSKIHDALAELELGDFSIGYEFEVLEQSSISFRKSGRKIDHHFVITAENIEGGIHSALLEAVDRSLETNDKVTVAAIVSFVSLKRLEEARRELLTQATKSCRADADAIAGATGRALTGRVTISSVSTPGTQAIRNVRGRYLRRASSMAYEVDPSYIQIRKGFTANSLIPWNIEESITLTASYELN